MAGPLFTRPNFHDRQIVQYSGMSITLSGDTNINQTGNLRIQKGAFPGLVATSLDSDGTIVWGPISGISWSISGCTSPLYVNNLVSCPSSGGTIQIDAGNLALNSELNFLISLSAGTNTDEVLVIDNNGYVKTIPNLMGIGNMWHIPVGYTLTVPDNYQSFIYGDMLIEGTVDLQTNAQLVVLNGNLILSGGSVIGSGTTYLVTIGGGCCFTGTTSGSCLSDICIDGILSTLKDILVRWIKIGTGKGDYVTNTVVGKDALDINISGTYNTAVGSEVLSANTTGSYNTAVGTSTLKNNTIGGGNTAIGSGTLINNVDGYANTAMGFNSMASNINGYANTALGLYTLHDNDSGTENTSVGYYSLFYNTNGYSNTSVGNQSLQNNSTGYANTAVGFYSLKNNTIGFNNTSVGNASGNGNNTGNYNTFLGCLSDTIISNLVNGTAIGYGATVNQNDSMVLGNGLINVGIGTSTPSSTLHLIGLSGFTQLRLETQYTPTGTADVNGSQGDVAWDDNFIYIKTSAGWKRTGLSTF